jgi:hypothetical protein
MGQGYRCTNATVNNFDNNAKSMWNAYNGALLYYLTEIAEAQGYMRGHLAAEFVASSEFKYHWYQCNTDPAHQYVIIRKNGIAAPPNLGACPDCVPPINGALNFAGSSSNSRFNFNGIGLAIGACWNFISADANIITHEVGHHRHFEHSANGPYTKPALHDSAANAVVNWVADAALRSVWWDDVSHRTNGDPNVADDAQHRLRGKQWDRRCMMSYANDSRQYFCGKCALRNRGWAVATLPDLPGEHRDPD